MRIQEIMTRETISVAPETSLKDVARLLVANRISGVPVCAADGTVVGVVSEADILRKLEGVSPELSRPIAWLSRKLDGELEKISAGTAGEVMSSPARTAGPNDQVPEVARLMVDCRINRVPVVSDGRIIGIVSRADLVRAFIRSDEEIEHDIREGVLLREMLLEPGVVAVSVDQGRIALSGTVQSQADADAIDHRVRRIPGVLGVTNELRWSQTDSRRTPVHTAW
jgi:CBS domain-containing protein